MRHRSMLIIMATVLVDMIGFGIIIPLIPFYAEEMGASPFEVTLLFASFSAMQLVATPLWGRISDRHGRRPLLVAGLFASAASHLIYGLAGTLSLLFISRMTAGAAGGTISIAQAYVADTTTDEDRAKGMGWIGAASGLGVMLGPGIGGYFSQWGLGTPGFIAAGLAALNGVAALLFLPESRPPQAELEFEAGEAATLRGWAAAMTRFPLSLLLGIYFLAIASFNGMISVLALYLERAFAFDGESMGYVMMLSGAVTVLVRGAMLGPLVKRFGEVNTARFGAVTLALSIALVPVIPHGLWIAAVAPLWAMGAGTLFPALATMVSRATDAASQGSVMGGSQVVGGLGRVLGPAGAGLLFQHWSKQGPFWTGAVVVVAAALLAGRIPPPSTFRRRPPSPGAGVPGAPPHAGAAPREPGETAGPATG
ncbi:MAG TPA: MFS transporter [Longimicrobiales bacterium]|nr:MFS transporter [Longimicrobiales bacterium]